jgi:hypothetical protein
MTYDDLRSQTAPLPSIDAVLSAHGAGKVLRAAALAVLRGRFAKPRPPDLRTLSDHMVRDIGLPPWGMPDDRTDE